MHKPEDCLLCRIIARRQELHDQMWDETYARLVRN